MEMYSLIVSNKRCVYNIVDISKEQLEIAINAYKIGKEKFTLNGKQYTIDGSYFKVYKNLENHKYKPHLEENSKRITDGHSSTNDYIKGNSLFGFRFTEKYFTELGKAIDITNETIGDKGFGDEKEEVSVPSKSDNYIDESIIEEIRKIQSPDFDFTRLIKLLEELNCNYSLNNLYSVAFILRAIIDHTPPLFNKSSFAEVCNQHPFGRSDKSLVKKLQDFSRDVSDREIHTHISRKVLPITQQEIDYKSSLAALVKEIIRLYH